MSRESEVELVFVIPAARGHLMAAVELAKRIVLADHRLSAVIIVVNFNPKTTTTHAHAFPDLPPRLRFVDVIPPTLPDPDKIFVMIQEQKHAVREELLKIAGPDRRLGGVVLDLLCINMLDLADEVSSPSYVLLTSGAFVLWNFLHLQYLKDCKDALIHIPSIKEPIPAEIVDIMLGQDKAGVFLEQCNKLKETKGILVNTFPELESRALESLSSDETLPPVFSIGPILHETQDKNPNSDEILEWLDQQPHSSVVFLCFGSMGWFNDTQIKEIAAALETTGYSYLWSLKKLPSEADISSGREYTNLEEVLPEGFLQRTAATGKVVGWAPQTAVLSHPAIGGFVSHCGWNSTLESIKYGVPMAAWPLFAEQHVNAFQLVKDLEMATEIKLNYRWSREDGGSQIVTAEEIEKGIRVLMEPGNVIRVNAREIKVKSRLALEREGSSSQEISRFIQHLAIDSV